MNIVINTRPLSKHSLYCYSNFIKGYLLKIVYAHPEHSFFFIADSITGKELASKKFTIINTAPKSANILLWKIWYAYKLPALLKKYKAGLFVNMDSICSFKTNVPQCLLVPYLSLDEHAVSYKKNIAAFFKKQVPLLLFRNL